MQIHTQNCTL